jgi:hypothetical protein
MRSAALRLDESNFDRRQPIEYSSNHHSKTLHVVHSVSPSLLPQKYEAERAVQQLDKNTLGIRERIHTALKNRIGLGKPASVKIVARATGLTERTIENAMSGDTLPRSDTLMALVDFFDATFANEIFGHLGIVVVKPAEASRKVAQGLHELSQADPTVIGIFAEALAKMGASR